MADTSVNQSPITNDGAKRQAGIFSRVKRYAVEQPERVLSPLLLIAIISVWHLAAKALDLPECSVELIHFHGMSLKIYRSWVGNRGRRLAGGYCDRSMRRGQHLLRLRLPFGHEALIFEKTHNRLGGL